MKLKEVTYEQIPSFGGIQTWNPRWRDMTLDAILEDADMERDYVPYGYNTFLFCRSTATIYIYNSQPQQS